MTTMWTELIVNALLVAAVPLSVVWVSNDVNKYRKLVFVTLFLTFDLIMFGAFTRLTDSGLGCPDWPGCYGAANPLQSHQAISAAEQLMPHGPVTYFKAWIEMIHRYLAASVGVLILTQTIIAWFKRKQFAGAPVFATALLCFVALQGAFGAWTVTMKLQPVIVTTHLLLGMGLLAMLAWLAARIRATTADGADGGPRIAHAALKLKWPARLAWLLLVAQIALGGWVSTNYAVLACTDYPLCQGVLVPNMDFEQGFTLWRELGKTADGHYLSFEALTAIHWVHRNFALLVVLVVGYVALRARRIDGLGKVANLILVVLLVQFCSGLANILLEWPLPVAVLHNGGAAMLLGLLTVLNYRVQSPVEMRRR